MLNKHLNVHPQVKPLTMLWESLCESHSGYFLLQYLVTQIVKSIELIY